MYLGIGIAHDAGVVLTDRDGKVLWAAGEERYSRVKNHAGFPKEAMSDLFRNFDPSDVQRVVFGTYGTMTVGRVKSVVDLVSPQPFPAPTFGKNTDRGECWTTPGDEFVRGFSGNPEDMEVLKSRLVSHVADLLNKEFDVKAPISFVNHHDAHSASAFVASGFERALVVTMDGQGDGESITIRLIERGIAAPKIVDLVRCSYRDSFGHIYSAVTNLYGLKINRHEGKVLGLAALGKPSALINRIGSLISIDDGIPKVSVPSTAAADEASARVEGGELRHTDRLEYFMHTLKADYFADLAYAVQYVVEEKILQLIQYWMSKCSVDCVALAGGVFANVKVNQTIAETIFPGRVYVYPNMGDGGLPAGAVWDFMMREDEPISEDPHRSMLTGPDAATEVAKLNVEQLVGVVKYRATDEEHLAGIVAQLVSEGVFCGLVNGRMEFGPRALGNRTILADPRHADVNQRLNERLRRSEYMPFAPICLEEDFATVFDVDKHGSMVPFRFMTMLCKVKDDWVSKIPAVVHVDGTARPQLVSTEIYPFLRRVLMRFKNLTGVPCMVNTSFNLHEEPIVLDIDDALRALRSGGVDVVVSGCNLFLMYRNRTLEERLTTLGCRPVEHGV